MPNEIDAFHFTASFALNHKITHAKFRKFWRSLDDSDKDMIARNIGAHFKLANFAKGPPIPIAPASSFPRIKK
jgi:hypothetical protein